MRAAMIALAASGCSFAFQKSLPEHWTIDKPATCDTEGDWPFDIVGAGLLGGAGVVGLAIANGHDMNGNPPSTANVVLGTSLGIVGLLGFLVYGASAYEGQQWTEECRRAKEQQKWHPRFQGDVDPRQARVVVSQFCFDYAIDGFKRHQCLSTLKGCEAKRGLLVGSAQELGACVDARTPVAAPVVVPDPPRYCFGYADDGKPVTRCLPTMDSCRQQREQLAGVNAENLGECGEVK